MLRVGEGLRSNEGVNIADGVEDVIGEHGVVETRKRLRLALADGFLRDAECSLKEGIGVQFDANCGLVELIG